MALKTLTGAVFLNGVLVAGTWAPSEPRQILTARASSKTRYSVYPTIKDDIDVLNEKTSTLVKQNIACDRLPRLEGVGPISSVLLYATRGTGEAFATGRQFSAYPELRPKQYSSGGKTGLIGISWYVANKGQRAVLIQGGAHLRAPIEGPQDTQGALALGIDPGGRVWPCDSVSTNKPNIRIRLIYLTKMFA